MFTTEDRMSYVNKNYVIQTTNSGLKYEYLTSVKY
jgi:hypothetical protein